MKVKQSKNKINNDKDAMKSQMYFDFLLLFSFYYDNISTCNKYFVIAKNIILYLKIQIILLVFLIKFNLFYSKK